MTDDKKTDKTDTPSPKPKETEAFQVSSNGTVTPPKKEEPKKAEVKATGPDVKPAPKVEVKKDPAKGTADPKAKTTDKAAPASSKPSPAPKKKGSVKPYLYGVALIALGVAGLTVYPIIERGAGTPSLPEPLGQASLFLNEQAFGPAPVAKAAPQVEDRFAPLESRIQALEASGNADVSGVIKTLEDRIEVLEIALAEQNTIQATSAPIVDAPANISDIQIRLTELTDRISELETMPVEDAVVSVSDADPAPAALAKPIVDAAVLGDLIARLDQAEAALGEVQTEMSGALEAESASRQEALSDVETRLAEQMTVLDQRISQSGTGMAALAFGLSNLQRAIDSGQAYGLELDAVREDLQKAGFEAAVVTFTKSAESGVPTVRDLQETFPAAIKPMLEAAQAGEAPGWQDRVMARLSNIVTVRKTGNIEGSDIESVLARLERHLSRRDVASAQAEVAGLPKEAQDAGVDWLSQLALRAEADQTIRTLFADMVQRIDG